MISFFEELLNSYNTTVEELIQLEKEHNLKKISYETDKLKLKYSEDYSKFKTIKEKEERAYVATAPLLEEIKIQEAEIKELKLAKELLNMEIKANLIYMDTKEE